VSEFGGEAPGGGPGSAVAASSTGAAYGILASSCGSVEYVNVSDRCGCWPSSARSGPFWRSRPVSRRGSGECRSQRSATFARQATPSVPAGHAPPARSRTGPTPAAGHRHQDGGSSRRQRTCHVDPHHHR
jgi:hypothetical protein